MQMNHLLYCEALLCQFLLVRIYFVFEIEVVPVVFKPGILQASQAAFQSSVETACHDACPMKSVLTL